MNDFIEVIDNAVDPALCAAIVAQMQQSQGLRAGEVGGGVYPELKHSRDLRLAGQPEWAQANAAIQQAVFAGLLTGRAVFGWRGRIALRWTLIGFAMLLLAYVGSRFVLEVLLGRG